MFRNLIKCKFSIFLIVFIWSSTFAALNFDPTAYYRIACRAGGYVLDNNSSSTAGTNIYQNKDQADISTNQQWMIIPIGITGYYKFKCNNSTLVLDNSNSNSNNTVMKQSVDNSGSNPGQQWQIIDLNNGYYRMVCKSNSMVLDNHGSAGAVMQWNAVTTSPNQQWKIEKIAYVQKNFVLGTFWDPCLYIPANSNPDDPANQAQFQADCARFQTCKNAYFNLLTNTGNFTPINQAQKNYALAVAANVGLKYLMQDAPTASCPDDNTWCSSVYSDQRVISVTNFYKTLKSDRRNALEGYFVAHEPLPNKDVPCLPGTNWLANIQSWVKGFNKYDPSRLSHICLPNPSLLNQDWVQWAQWTELICNNYSDPLTRPQALCWCEYPFQSNGYFQLDYFNLNNAIRAKAGSRPFWHYILSTDYNELLTSEYTIRFQNFVPMAYGAKGILYLHYSWNGGHNGIVGTSADPCSGTPLFSGTPPQDEKYAFIQSLNNYVTRIIAPVIMNAYNLGAYHQSTAPQPNAPISSDQMLAGKTVPVIYNLGNDNAMVGIFRDKSTYSTYYLLVVNKGSSPTGVFSVSMYNNLTNNVSLSPSAIDYKGSTEYPPAAVSYDAATDRSTIQMPSLEAGEGRIIKIMNVPFWAQGDIAAAKDVNGFLWCFARGTNGNIYYRKQSSIANFTNWGTTGWQYLSGPVTGNMTVGANKDGLLFIYAPGPAGQLQCLSQGKIDNNIAWLSQWSECGGCINSQIAVAQYDVVAKRQAVFARSAADNMLYFAIQNGPNDAPSNWQKVPFSPVIGDKIAAATNPGSGTIEVFVTDASKQLLHAIMQSPTSWTAFTVLGPDVQGDVLVGKNQDNRLEAFYNTSTSMLAHCWQTTAGGATWSAVGGLTVSNQSGYPMAIGTNSDGRLEICFWGYRSQMMHDYQNTPNGAWSTYQLMDNGSVPVSQSGRIALGNFSNGRLVAFCLSGSNIYYSYQDAANWYWMPFVPLSN